MTDRMTANEAIATGRVYVNYSPLDVLKELRAAVGWNDGYVIRLGADHEAYLFRRLQDCIAFHEGADTLRNVRD